MYQVNQKLHRRNVFIATEKNKAYQEFIFKLSEMIDLLCPSKKLRLKANSKDSETTSVIRKMNKLFKKYKKSGFETGKDYFRSVKMAL